MIPEKKLIVRVRNVYGTNAIYPVNETAKAFARIAGTKTLTHLALCEAEKLGYLIEAEPEPVPASVSRWARQPAATAEGQL